MIVSSVHFIEFACVLISVFSPFFANHHQHHCYNILRSARHLKAINDFTVHQIMAPQKFHAEPITQMHNQSFIFMEKKNGEEEHLQISSYHEVLNHLHFRAHVNHYSFPDRLK